MIYVNTSKAYKEVTGLKHSADGLEGGTSVKEENLSLKAFENMLETYAQIQMLIKEYKELINKDANAYKKAVDNFIAVDNSLFKK